MEVAPTAPFTAARILTGDRRSGTDPAEPIVDCVTLYRRRAPQLHATRSCGDLDRFAAAEPVTLRISEIRRSQLCHRCGYAVRRMVASWEQAPQLRGPAVILATRILSASVPVRAKYTECFTAAARTVIHRPTHDTDDWLVGIVPRPVAEWLGTWHPEDRTVDWVQLAPGDSAAVIETAVGLWDAPAPGEMGTLDGALAAARSVHIRPP